VIKQLEDKSWFMYGIFVLKSWSCFFEVTDMASDGGGGKGRNNSVNMMWIFRNIPTHSDALKYFITTQCIRPPTLCSNCGSTLSERKNGTNDGFTLRCNACDTPHSPRAGSWFEDIRLPFNKLLLLMYCWSQEFSHKLTMHEVDVSKQTVTDYFNKFRQVCFREFGQERQIGGPGVVVQIDETHIFTRKYNVGRVLVSEQCWVFGGIDLDGNVFLDVVPNRNAKTLTEVLIRRVVPGSIIHSDGWRGYSFLCTLYDHYTVNHTRNFVDPKTKVHTQRIEATWHLLKDLLAKKGTRKCSNLDWYLAEFSFRRYSKGHTFEGFLDLIKHIPYPVKEHL